MAVRALLFVAIACLAIIGLEAWHTIGERQQRLLEIEAQTKNLAQSVVQHAEDTIEMADTALVGLVERLEHDGASPQAMERLARLLSARVTALPRIRGLFVYDSEGRWLATSLPGIPPGLNNADREYFQHHRSNADRGPFVGLPVKSKSGGQWIVTVTRRYDHPDGSFAGVVLASIDAEYFTRWYATFNVGIQGSIALFNNDGKLLTRWPLDEAAIGRSIVNPAMLQLWLSHPAGGVQHYKSRVDGIDRLSSYRPSTRYPVIAQAAVGAHEALTDWRATAWLRLTAATALAALVGLLGLRLAGHMHQRQQTQRALAESEAKFRLLAENSSDMVAFVGLDGMRRYVSPASRRLLGRSPEELVGKPAIDAIHPEDRANLLTAIGRLRSRDADEFTITYRMRRADGTDVWVEATIRVSRDPTNDAATGIVVVSRDITRRKTLEAQLAALAATDSLTGLANRRTFDEHLAGEWRRATREQTALSLLLIDVDHFKAFNDRHGHQAGDDCLRVVATTIAGTARRPADLAARYGGEEFAVILPSTDAAGAAELAERIRAAVDRLATPPVENTTVSVGTATVRPGATGGTSALIAAADAALYAAKRAGRNRVMAAPPTDAPVAASAQS